MLVAAVAGALLLWRLADVVLLLFLAIVVAAALQPWHAALQRLGVPRGAAILLLYLALIAVLVGFVVVVGPYLADRIGVFLATIPERWGQLLQALQASRIPPLRQIGWRLPPFDALSARLTSGIDATSLRGIFGLTTGIIAAVTYVFAIFAVALYWTLEVSRVERLFLSFVPVARRANALTMWHEIESRLGAFIRGQVLVMIAVGAASGIGYAAIGLPDALILGLLAGLLEAVPVLGPLLAAVPAVLLALPLGVGTVLAVVACASFVQILESNVLLPRVMSHAVGLSALGALVALLVFGSLGGALGMLAAIPVAVVMQVLVDHLILDETPAPPVEVETSFAALQRRAQELRDFLRARLRVRESRMGIDPTSPDHVGDALDQRLEHAVERIVAIIATTEHALPMTAPDERTRILGALERAVEEIGGAVAATTDPSAPPPPAPPAEAEVSVEAPDAQRVDAAVEQVDAVADLVRDRIRPHALPRRSA
jgi:predicted PurR-regulated permease PerM